MSDQKRLPNGIYIVNLKHDVGLDDKNILINTVPSHSGVFILPISKRNMINFPR